MCACVCACVRVYVHAHVHIYIRTCVKGMCCHLTLSIVVSMYVCMYEILVYTVLILMLSADIDECNLSPCQHRCQNAFGSFQCHCDTGYNLNTDGLTCKREHVIGMQRKLK